MKYDLKSVVAIIMIAAVLGTTSGMPPVSAKSAVNQTNNPTEHETVEDLISKIEGEISKLEGLSGVVEEDVLAVYTKQELTQLKLSVEELDLPQGIENSLLAKLGAASEKINRALGFIQDGDEKQADNMLNTVSNILVAFNNELESQKGKKITEEDIASLSQKTKLLTEVIKEKNIESALEELELVEKPEVLVEIDQSIGNIQESIAGLQALGLTVEFREEDGTHMVVITGSPIVWKIVVPLAVKAMATVAGAIFLVEYRLGETLTLKCKVGLYVAISLFYGAMTALSTQKALVALGLGIWDAAAADALIGWAFGEILGKMAEYAPACILPLSWTTCSGCPEPPEVSIVGNRVCMGVADRSEGDTQGVSVHGASALLPQSEKYQVAFEFDLHTWDSYNAPGTLNPPYYGGTGYWDSFSISISPDPYWTLSLADPVTEVGLPGLGFLWGGTSYGDGFIESNSGIQTIEMVGNPNTSNYLNVVLDTATLPYSNHVYPSWGCIGVKVVPK